MNLPPLPFVVLDTETTGFVPRTHRVIEFACVHINKKGETTETYEQLFALPEIPSVVQALTHIHTSDLAGRPRLEECRETILSKIGNGTLIVGQNTTFDINMLKGEGIDLSHHPWIDTSILSSLVFPELESYSLGYLSRVLELPHEPAHRALGDVTATLALLAKCWERLCELPPDLLEIARNISDRGPKGYKMLFEALPKTKKKTAPKWLMKELPMASDQLPKKSTLAIGNWQLVINPVGSVQLVEESLDPNFLPSLITSLLQETKKPCLAGRQVTNQETCPPQRTWIAVKNLESTIRRLKSEGNVPEGVSVLHPPFLLPDVEAVKHFATQETYTNDEMTLALKLALYEPSVQSDFPLHGSGEEAVWNGKIACTETSKAYVEQFSSLASVILLDHRQLLAFLADPAHAAHGVLKESDHIIIENASMLEDTATKAYGWFAAMDDLRAAAEGNTALTKFLDVLQLWIEKVRQFQTIRYLAVSDLRSPDAHGLRKQLAELVEKGHWPEQSKRRLQNLTQILDPEKLSHRIAYIEQKQNGSQILHSVPERIGEFLKQQLYIRFPTTLLIPQGSATMLPEIIPAGVTTKPSTLPVRQAGMNHEPINIPLEIQSNVTIEELLHNPPPGKSIILITSKGAIETLFVKYEEALEEEGITLICQGVSGGHGRMQAEFLVSPAKTLWLITPWAFEGIELPRDSVDHLFIQTLPFDHPSHAILSRRSELFRDAFSEYMIPRLLHRLFRLLRTFSRFRTVRGNVTVMDNRLETKNYGPRVKEYLKQFAEQETKEAEESNEIDKSIAAAEKPTTNASTPKPKKKTKKKNEEQLMLF